jgi:hypothetical protein
LFQIFRPLPRYWISKAIWFLLLGIAAGYLALRYHVLVALWPGFFAGKDLFELYRLRQMRVELDTQGLLFQMGAETYWVAWNEVVVAQQVGRISSIFYRLEMTSEEIQVIRLRKRQRMRWDEMDYIQHDFGWHRWVAYGDNKHLAAVGIQMLSGDDQAEMMDMLNAQIEQRSIETRRKERALFTWSRNVS